MRIHGDIEIGELIDQESGDSLRGVFSKSKIKQWTVLVEVPETAAITCSYVHKKRPQILEGIPFLDTETEIFILIRYVAYERFVILRSEWDPFFDMYDKVYDPESVIHKWKPSWISALKEHGYEIEYENKMVTIRKIVRHFKQIIKFNPQFWTRELEDDEITWAISFVISKAFSLPESFSPSWNDTPEQDPNSRLRYIIPILADLCNQNCEDHKKYQSGNHITDFDTKKKFWTFKIHHEANPGDQIFNCYDPSDYQQLGNTIIHHLYVPDFIDVDLERPRVRLTLPKSDPNLEQKVKLLRQINTFLHEEADAYHVWVVAKWNGIVYKPSAMIIIILCLEDPVELHNPNILSLFDKEAFPITETFKTKLLSTMADAIVERLHSLKGFDELYALSKDPSVHFIRRQIYKLDYHARVIFESYVRAVTR